jgi:glyoxylase-like metal-dependent hydrolase (beta-lactamase superfamily II)
LEDGLTGWSAAYERVDHIFEVWQDKRVKVVQLRRIGKGCLSYIVESSYEAAIIDPLLPIEDYLTIAEGEMNAKITKVMDTHLHADHVSGAKELAEKREAQLYLSPYENYKEIGSFSRLNDGDVIRIGSVLLQVIYIHQDILKGVFRFGLETSFFLQATLYLSTTLEDLT